MRRTICRQAMRLGPGNKIKRLPYQTILWFLLFAVALSYVYAKSKNIAAGPRLQISSPEDGTMLNQSLIKVAGRAERIAALTLNGDKILVDELGQFEEKLLLAPGYNIIRIEATDKFDRKVAKELNLVYVQKE